MGSNKYPKIAGFELVKQIGGGGFSTVYSAVNFDEHRTAACKHILITEQTTEKDRKTIDKEMKIHAALKHKNVLEFYNAVVVELQFKHKYVPGIYMLLEFAAGGDLFDKIAPDVGVGDEVAHYYFNQLVAGMDFIHAQGVCHRDLKPENLLLDAAGTLKVSDFGLASVYKLKESGKTRALTERCGSLPYVAPELNSDAPYQAEPIDVWGVGVILFTLLAGNTPWDEPTMRSPEFVRYVSGQIFTDAPWNRLSDTALSLIRGMLTIDPAQRMTLSDVQQHPWVIRPSQLEGKSAHALADLLTQSLRLNGDMGYAAPDLGQGENANSDEDEPMGTASSQFTQSLMLFSQTQSGARYTPHLTRFYASLGPSLLLQLIQESLSEMQVQFKVPKQQAQRPRDADAMDADDVTVTGSGSAPEFLRLRIGGYDQRKVMYKGWIELEPFAYRGQQGTFCIMKRDEGSPISWRQLWKALVMSPVVDPHVLRK